MNGPERTPATRTSSFSAEGLIGTGVTLAALGVLFLLLGWAQQMRLVKDAAAILYVIGAILTVLGGIVCMMGAARRRTR